MKITLKKIKITYGQNTYVMIKIPHIIILYTNLYIDKKLYTDTNFYVIYIQIYFVCNKYCLKKLFTDIFFQFYYYFHILFLLLVYLFFKIIFTIILVSFINPIFHMYQQN